MQSEDKTTFKIVVTPHTDAVGAVSVESVTAILANAMRGELHRVAGDDPSLRLVTLGAFLFHLCQVEPERADAMRGILAAVSDAVTAKNDEAQAHG